MNQDAVNLLHAASQGRSARQIAGLIRMANGRTVSFLGIRRVRLQDGKPSIFIVGSGIGAYLVAANEIERVELTE